MSRRVLSFLAVVLLAGCSSAPKLSWPTSTAVRIPINSNYASSQSQTINLATASAPIAITPQVSSDAFGQVVKLTAGKVVNDEQGFLDEPADGKSDTTFTAMVNDATGKPARQGVVVLWDSNLGNLSAPSSVTDTQGRASIVLTAPTKSGWATIVARTEKATKGEAAIVRYCSDKSACREIGAYAY